MLVRGCQFTLYGDDVFVNTYHGRVLRLLQFLNGVPTAPVGQQCCIGNDVVKATARDFGRELNCFLFHNNC